MKNEVRKKVVVTVLLVSERVAAARLIVRISLDVFLFFFFKFFVERAVMIRKLEHDREKLSSQLERSQESASQAKKIARESEKAVKTERENAARLEVCF